MAKILSLFGTRPEVIKLAPVIRALEARSETFRTINVASGQHDGLAAPFIRLFAIRVDHELKVMAPGQTPSQVAARILTALDPVLATERPDLVLVQGDTTTAVAGALAAFHRGIPVGHVEAGLRSGDPQSPFPEEMNRRLITQLASWHFAATDWNRRNLQQEGVAEGRIFVTGNPVVDALETVRARLRPSLAMRALLERTTSRRIVLTTHRRESFGGRMIANLTALRSFVESHDDATLLFPIHPNPQVVQATREALGEHERIHRMEPLGYEDFVYLLSRSFLIVSDSGGVQEEAPSLGKPLLVLRENTERPEALTRGTARLADSPERLRALLEEAWQPRSWADGVTRLENPFGQGDAGERIAHTLAEILTGSRAEPARAAVS